MGHAESGLGSVFTSIRFYMWCASGVVRVKVGVVDYCYCYCYRVGPEVHAAALRCLHPIVLEAQ